MGEEEVIFFETGVLTLTLEQWFSSISAWDSLLRMGICPGNPLEVMSWPEVTLNWR